MGHIITHIIIADDHEVVRIGLSMLLEKVDGLNLSCQAESFEALGTALLNHPCDLLIVDLNLGDKNGINIIRELHENYPKLPILVMSSYPEIPYALQSFKAGARGYLNKGTETHILYDAIKTIMNGRKYVSPTLEQELPYGTDLNQESLDVSTLLSSRELEVLNLLGSGIPSKQIAERMGLSPKTISTYRSRILEKLNLSSSAELVRFSMENDLSGY